MGLGESVVLHKFWKTTETRNLEETEKPFYNAKLQVHSMKTNTFIQFRKIQVLDTTKCKVKGEILMSTITRDRPEYLKMKDTESQPLIRYYFALELW